MKPALHFPRLGKTLLAAALVAMAGTGCVEIQTRTTATQPSRSLAADRAIEGDITSAKALEFVYGNVQQAKPGKKEFSFGGMGGDGGLSCTEWALVPLGKGKEAELCTILGEKYTDGDTEKYLLVAAYENQDRSVFTTSVFVKKNGQWVHEPGMANLYDGREINGSAGFIASVEPMRAKGGKPGVLITHINCGTLLCSLWVNVIVPYGNDTKVFPLYSPDECSFETRFEERECSPSEQCQGYIASFDKVSHDGYHDIIVKYDDGHRSRGTQRWTFQNGKYVKAKAAKKGSKKGAKKRK